MAAHRYLTLVKMSGILNLANGSGSNVSGQMQRDFKNVNISTKNRGNSRSLSHAPKIAYNSENIFGKGKQDSAKIQSKILNAISTVTVRI